MKSVSMVCVCVMAMISFCDMISSVLYVGSFSTKKQVCDCGSSSCLPNSLLITISSRQYSGEGSVSRPHTKRKNKRRSCCRMAVNTFQNMTTVGSSSANNS